MESFPWYCGEKVEWNHFHGTVVKWRKVNSTPGPAVSRGKEEGNHFHGVNIQL